MARFCQIHPQLQNRCGILYLHSVAQVATQVKQDSVRVQSPMGNALPSASIMFKSASYTYPSPAPVPKHSPSTKSLSLSRNIARLCHRKFTRRNYRWEPSGKQTGWRTEVAVIKGKRRDPCVLSSMGPEFSPMAYWSSTGWLCLLLYMDIKVGVYTTGP